jgi:cardiolipin synthase
VQDFWLRWGAAVVLTVAQLLTMSCKSPEPVEPIGEEVPAEPPLLALEAYRGYDQYFLRYLRDDEVFYTLGDLKGRTPPAIGRDIADYGTPTVAPMRHDAPEDWVELTSNLTPVPILGIEQWSEFRDSLFGEFLPRERNTGVAVSFDRADYFFFYDQMGRFRARRLIDKPPWYTVTTRIDLTDYFDRWQPKLEAYLARHKLSGGEVLFNTGDLDKGAIPFVYVNTHSRLIVLIRYDEISEDLQEQVQGSHVLQSLWHFIGSHSYSVPMRPISSVQTLLSLVTDTAIESGRNLLTGIPLEARIPPLADIPPMDLAKWEGELDYRLGRRASRGKLDFLVDGEQFFPRFIDQVTSAQESVDIRAYIFDNDDVALEIAELLKRRSNEGLDIRVLFDGLGTITAGGEHPSSLPEDHRAPASIRAYLTDEARTEVRTVKNTWFTGDHAKTMVVDQRTAYLGGMNIGREYRYDWHDLMVEVTGPVVDEINQEFSDAWSRAGLLGDFGPILTLDPDPVNEHSDGYPLRLIYTRPGRHEIYDLQREAIRRSRRYIYIENAYFTDDTLLRELVKARRRGVDVRVVIPLETDRGVITRNIALAANTMLKHGIRVYIYPGFTHAKAAIYDGWACMGSANLDRLSLKINREINVATSEPSAVRELMEELFERDFATATELVEPFPEQWADYLIEIFGDYIF